MAAAPRKTMKAVVCTAIGDPKQVLKVRDLPMPQLSTRKNKTKLVLIKVLCASINPIDYKMINGLLGVVNPKKPPFVVGRDFSGRVIEKGSDPSLRWINVGDLVYGQCWISDQGSFAEYCLCESSNLQPMPQKISALQAAAIPLVSQTSYQAMLKMDLKKTDKLLILGGSTATGLAAIQIAKRFVECQEVVVTSSQIDLCKSLGADRVINYKQNEVWYKLCKDYAFDAIYDCVGGQESWDLCRSQGVLKKDGYFLTIVGDNKFGSEPFSGGALVSTALSVINRKFWGAVGNQKYEFFVADSSKNLRDISSLVDGGKLRPVLDPESPFKMHDFMSMVEKSMVHKARGKLVMCISEDEQDEQDDQKKNDDSNGGKVVEEEENGDDIEQEETDNNHEKAKIVEEEANVPAPKNDNDEKTENNNADQNDNDK